MSDLAFDGGYAPSRSAGLTGPGGALSDGFIWARHQPQPVSPRIRRETVDHEAGCPITVRRWVDQRFDLPWHQHPEVELHLVVNGRGLRHVGDSIEPFGPGDLVLVGGGTPHCWLSPRSTPSTDAAIVLHFSLDVFGYGFLALHETRPLALLLRRAALGLHFDGRSRDDAANILCDLTRPDITRLEKLSGLVSLLTVLTAGSGGRVLALDEARSVTRRESSRADDVLRYIREHASERMSRSELARVAGMSLGTFSRFFARQFGKPFVTYVAEVRIANACSLLREQDHSVSEVAYHVGFRNLANFNRTFRRFKGMTPTTYRKVARSAVVISR